MFGCPTINTVNPVAPNHRSRNGLALSMEPRRFALCARLGFAAAACVSLALAEPKLPEKYAASPFSLMSLTVGAPNDGWQLRAKRLRDTPHLKVKSSSKSRTYGHPALVLMLERSAKDISKAVLGSVMVVGDLSAKAGGPIGGHRSHQSGRDADVGFYLRNEKGNQVVLDQFVKIDGEGKVIGHRGVYFDDVRNWELVRSWLRDKRAGISHVFVAAHVRNRLLAYARSSNARKAYHDDAAKLLHQPSNSAAHDDHYHVRITCPQRQKDICTEQAVSD
jgi:penicillin-insensitive murein DD-endopeptidase